MGSTATARGDLSAADLPEIWRVPFQAGFSVIPVEKGGKRPIGQWKQYQIAPPSIETVHSWAARPSNVGIVTGAVSGLVVLDLDSEAAMQEAERRGLPPTVVARTAKGRHVYFRHPGGTIGNRAALLPGMDLRGDGGQVVAPGSVHPTGALYSWVSSPEENALADMPQWLLDALAQPERAEEPGYAAEPTGAADAAIDKELAALRRAPEGQRNAQLNKSSFALGQISRHLDGSTTRKLLESIAEAIGLRPSEIKTTVASGWKAGALEPRELPAAGEQEVRIRATPYRRTNPADIPPRPWIYGRQLLRGSLSVIVAPGAVGKTSLLVGTALALATGQPLLGETVWGRPQRVWLWNLEDSVEELQRLIEAACAHWQLKEEATGDRLLVDSALEGAELCTAIEDKDGFRIVEPVIESLVAELVAQEIDVLVVDPFVSSHRVSENNNGAIDAVAKKWACIGVAANCSIVLVHHTKKLNGGEATAEGGRGAIALVNAARSVVALNKMSIDEAKKVGVREQERRRYFRAYDDKNNRAPPAEASTWYKLESVDLGNGTLEEPGDSVQVVVPWAPTEVAEECTLEQLEEVQKRIAGGLWKENFQAKDWAGHAVAEVLGIDAMEDRHRIMRLLKAWIEQHWFVVVERIDPKRRDTRKFLEVRKWVRDETGPEGELHNQT